MQVWNEAKYTPEEFLKLMGDQIHDKMIFNEINKLSCRSVIDIGCGPGALLNFLRDKYIYTGVDSCEKYIKYCRRRFPQATFIISSVEDFQFTQTYDVCVFKSVLQYVPDYLTCIINAKKYCKYILIMNDHLTDEPEHRIVNKNFDGFDYIEIFRSRIKMPQELADIGEITMFDRHKCFCLIS